MLVEQLIEKLQEMDPAANVMFEGEGDMCWGTRDVVDDDNGRFVILLRGKEHLVQDEDSLAAAPPNGADTKGGA